jgi:hypothetical protein
LLALLILPEASATNSSISVEQAEREETRRMSGPEGEGDGQRSGGSAHLCPLSSVNMEHGVGAPCYKCEDIWDTPRLA